MSLIELQRKQFLSALESVKPPSRLKIVVVDSRSLKLLGNVLRMSEISEYDVIKIENIEKRRKPEPGIEAMYILTPSKLAITYLIADFTSTGQHNIKGKNINESPVASYVRALKELCVEFEPVEEKLYVTKLEDKEYYRLYSNRGIGSRNLEYGLIAKKVANVVSLVGDTVEVRYLMAEGKMYPETSRQIAESIQKELDKLEKGNEKGDDKKGTGKNKGVLLVVDRSVDLLAPLLHEFTYEAMAMDLAEEQIETDNKMRRKYNYSVDLANGQTEPRSMELGNNGSGGEDAVWREYRYQHISDAQGRLLKEVEKFAQSNKAIADFQSGGEGKANLTMVRDVVGAMPQFKAQMAIYGAHVNLMQRCMRRFNGDKLADLAIIEQNLVMGTTPENQKYVDGGLDIGQYLSSSNPKMNKLRLLLIFLLTNPRLTQTDRVKLLERASLSGDARSAVDGLDSIVPVSVANELREKIVAGCKKSKLTLSNVISTSKLWGSDSKKRGDSKAKDDDEVEETPYEVSRYVTALKYITEAVLSGHIDSSILKKAGAPSHRRAGGMFDQNQSKSLRKGSASPSSRTSPPANPPQSSLAPIRSLRSTKPTWQNAKTARSDQSEYSGSTPISSSTSLSALSAQNFYIFVVGGITYSEIRSVALVAAKRNANIYLGSTHIITPSTFLDGLSVLGDPSTRDDPSPSCYSLGYATPEDKDPLVMYLDSHSRTRFKGSPSPAAAAGAAGIEELFMQKLKASEAQWSDIKANKAGTASVSPSPLAFSPRASSANSSRPGSAAGGSSTGTSKKKGFFFR